ncbi:leucine-rich repeat domain-containing protein [Paenibacillus aurantius]|uniref:Leucine-rich repeat domain-containing protein n=1 Tax=Paenibacillus aurantius TaxID=2918900 RepID=A0AA96RGD7_9BACL|nr:leucine-rich repeat domain-containing protein [Paenibacillus aurantius]WNQ12223.1 leucine-rich repeat domain-containing protein [Paenibacillus aurantius]
MDNYRDGYKFSTGPLNRDTIIIEDNRTEDYVNYIKEKNIQSVYLCSPHYRKNDVNILSELSSVRKLNIRAPITNFEGLYAISENLQDLSLNTLERDVDLSRFSQLEKLSIEDGKEHILNLEKCIHLKQLYLLKYKPISKNIEELISLSKLNTLVLTQSSITSLKGCEGLKSLRKLGLNFLSKLEDIESLELVLDTLEELEIESCKSINFKIIGKLKNLKRLLLINCGELSSISFINSLEKLEFFVFTKTNIIDGDLSYCQGINYVAFDNKKHYSHKMKDFTKRTN